MFLKKENKSKKRKYKFKLTDYEALILIPYQETISKTRNI